MRVFTALLVGAMTVGVAITASPGRAASVCAPGTAASNSICNLEITFNADGSVTSSIPVGASTTYDGVEDALIGVINNTLHAITSFHLVGFDIGGFDGDGIDTFPGHTANPLAGNPDTTGYGGPLGFFTNNTGDALDVNFANGGVAPGASTYFSLEEPASLSLVVSAVPEPASLALVAIGLAGLGFARRRRD